MDYEIADVELMACAAATILIGIWGLWIGLRVAFGYQSAPGWVRWPLILVGRALLAQIGLGETVPDDGFPDLTFPGTISLLTLGVAVAVVHGIRRLTASQATGTASCSLH